MNELERDRNLPTTIVFNVEEVATMVEDNLRGYLKEAPSGLYTKKCLKPLVHFGRPYKALSPLGHKMQIFLTPETTFIKEGVVTDHLGNFAELLSGPGTALFKTPQRPIMGLQLVKDCIDATTRHNLKWSFCLPFSELLERHIKEEYLIPVQNVERYVENNVPVVEVTRDHNPHLIAIEERVNVLLLEIRALINGFVHNDPWGVYDIKYKDFDVTITRTGDFRVIDWMNRFGQHYK